MTNDNRKGREMKYVYVVETDEAGVEQVSSTMAKAQKYIETVLTDSDCGECFDLGYRSRESLKGIIFDDQGRAVRHVNVQRQTVNRSY